MVSSATYRELSWLPLGEPKPLHSPYCSAPQLERLMLAHQDHLETQAREVENFFRRCDRELTSGRLPWWRALLRLEKMVYPAEQHSQIQEVTLSLDSGEQVPALLALQESPRPLLILKCGVLCNSKRSIPFPLMHLFDEGHFHALFVGNTTGREYVSKNQQILFGGFHEGQQAVRLAQHMKEDSPWRDLFTSVHFLGVSLGGQGALYASLFNQHTSAQPEDRPLTSVYALCPVVNLQSTIEENYSQGVYGRLMQLKLWQNHRQISQSWPSFAEEIGTLQQRGIPLKELSQILSAAALPHLQRMQRQQPFLAPFQNFQFTEAQQVWWANNFLQQLQEPIETPTLAIGALDDGMVPASINFLPLYRAAFQQPQGQLRPVLTPQGSHCAHSLIYGWDVGGTLMRSFFLSQSPELLNRRVDRQAVVAIRHLSPSDSVGRSQQAGSQEAESPEGKDLLKDFHSWKWEVDFRQRFLVLKLFESPPQPMNPGPGHLRLKIAFADLPKMERALPQNPIEAQSFSRWANAQLQWSNLSLRGTEGASLRLSWTGISEN